MEKGEYTNVVTDLSDWYCWTFSAAISICSKLQFHVFHLLVGIYPPNLKKVLEIIAFNLQACITFNLQCMSNFCWWNLFYQVVVSVMIVIDHCTILYCSKWCKWIRLVKYTLLVYVRNEPASLWTYLITWNVLVLVKRSIVTSPSSFIWTLRRTFTL